MGPPREPSEAGRVGKGEKALTDGEAPLAGIRHHQGLFDVVRVWGLEPQRVAAREPKSRMSANSIIPA